MSKSSIALIANELEKMPDRVEDARRALGGWRETAIRVVKKNPSRSVIGAFAVGFILAKLGKIV
jgi:hypothetical protein